MEIFRGNIVDIVRILVDIEAPKRTSTTKKTKLLFVSR
jgi:hypothetical protein